MGLALARPNNMYRHAYNQSVPTQCTGNDKSTVASVGVLHIAVALY